MTSPAITSPRPAARFDRFSLGLLGAVGLLLVAVLIYGGYLLTVFLFVVLLLYLKLLWIV